MIPYEELCVALERYADAHRGEPQAHTAETPLPSAPAPGMDQPTGEHLMPHAPLGDSDDDHTNVGVAAVYDDRSNEIDIGDVLTDEDAHKN